MNKLKIILFAFLLLQLPALSGMATTRRVLFIGNSYTFTNNMPLMLQTFAANMGDTLIYDESDPGGYTLAMHCTYATTLTKIFSQQWDIVVLQEQSEMPSFPPAEVDTEVYPYAHKLDSLIHANDSCTQTMFLMTWGHANGDPPNCSFYPVICTYAGMQQRLRASYLQMTQDNHAIVAPVGAAWNLMMDSFATSIWLYISDSSHPAIPGSYLETCVLYSSIFHKPTLGCTDTAGLPTVVANTIQRISDKVVMDSLLQWQQYGHYPYAGFTDYCSGYAYHFDSHATITEHLSWAFGDGLFDTSTSPNHTYLSPSATYEVSLTATTNCFTETISKSITPPCLGDKIENQLAFSTGQIKTALQGNGKIIFMDDGIKGFEFLEVYDSKGIMVRKYRLTGKAISDNLVPGLYLLKAYSSNWKLTYNSKIIIY